MGAFHIEINYNSFKTVCSALHFYMSNVEFGNPATVKKSVEVPVQLDESIFSRWID